MGKSIALGWKFKTSVFRGLFCTSFVTRKRKDISRLFLPVTKQWSAVWEYMTRRLIGTKKLKAEGARFCSHQYSFSFLFPSFLCNPHRPVKGWDWPERGNFASLQILMTVLQSIFLATNSLACLLGFSCDSAVKEWFTASSAPRLASFLFGFLFLRFLINSTSLDL